MTDEVKADAGPSKGGSPILKIAIMAAVVIIPAVVGLLVFKIVIAPKLTDAAPEVVEEEKKTIPAAAVILTFDQQIATLIMPPNSNVPASLLLYQVALECANAETAAMIETHKARFLDMVRELHANKTRAEVDDPLVLASIKKQILQRGNEILALTELPPKSPPLKITDVFITQFTVQDQ